MRTHTPELDPRTLERLATYAAGFSHCFDRSDQARWAEAFLRGLLQDGDRKSVEPMVHRIELPPSCAVKDPVQAMQHWLNQGRWADSLLLREYRSQMRAALDGPEADFIFDDTSFIKQGQHSVGVQHQYCGSLGKRANCQVAVSLHYATTKGHYPLAMRLYLPDTWTSAPKRLEKARVPLEHRVPKTKHQIAIALLDEAIAESHQARTVLADAGYGSSSAFRKQLDERGLTYAVGVRAETVAFTKKPIWKRAGDKGVPPNRRHPRLADESPRPKSLEEIAATLKFRECKWREGTKGWLVAPFARTRVWPAQDWQNGTCADEKPVWLIVEKRGDELRYHFSNAPDGITMNHLVRLLKNRWPVEQGYQQLKEELGLDHFEGRSWPGFHHHVCMTLLAFGFLELERQRLKRDIKPGSQKNSTTAANAALCAACLAADSSTSATSSLLALQSED